MCCNMLKTNIQEQRFPFPVQRCPGMSLGELPDWKNKLRWTDKSNKSIQVYGFHPWQWSAPQNRDPKSFTASLWGTKGSIHFHFHFFSWIPDTSDELITLPYAIQAKGHTLTRSGLFGHGRLALFSIILQTAVAHGLWKKMHRPCAPTLGLFVDLNCE